MTDVQQTFSEPRITATSQLRQPTIYVILPVYNRKPLLECFLHGINRQTYRNFETIVVDDGSMDGTADMVAENFPDVHLLRGDGNLWWTGAINVGIRHALTRADAEDAILVINDDLEVDADYLHTLYEVWQKIPHALIGSVIVTIKHPNIIEDGGRIVNWWTAKHKILNSRRQLSDFPKDYCVDVSFLTGWGTLIPVQVFHEIGLYDDKHFQQCGDTELPVRARNYGFRLLVSYNAVIRIHTDDGINYVPTYTLRDAKQYFFGIKSNYRLKYRFFSPIIQPRTQ